MGVSIHYYDPAVYGTDPVERDLERVDVEAATVRAIVEALEARDSEARGVSGLVGRDSDQFGSFASRVNPDELAAIVATLPEALRPRGRFLDHVVAQRMLVRVDEELDGRERGAVPNLSSELERVDEPVLQWSNAHATEAMLGLGFADYSTSECLSLPAVELAAACAGRRDRDAVALAEVAAYALGLGGSGAMVSIA